MTLFNPRRHQVHRVRSEKLFHNHRFLYDDVAYELIDRLQDIKRNFPNVLNLSPNPLPLAQNAHQVENFPPPFGPMLSPNRQTYDLVISNLALHWVEDLVGLLIQIRHHLSPDGLFIGSFFGGDSLHELRSSLMEAEMQLTGGAALRTAPMIRAQDAPTVLGRAGFALPVVDTETYTLAYPNLKALVADLRGMGETLKTSEYASAPRDLFTHAEQIYREMFGQEDGTLPVTAEVLTLTGWGPCDSQQAPLKSGSATHSLRENLEG